MLPCTTAETPTNLGVSDFEITLKSAAKQLQDTQQGVQHGTRSAGLWVNPFVRGRMLLFHCSVQHLPPLHRAAEGSTPEQGVWVGQAQPLQPISAFSRISQTDCKK